jgi:sarcosine oxidase delta subunit
MHTHIYSHAVLTSYPIVTHTHMPSSPLTQSQHILTCRPHLLPNRNTYSHAVLTSHPIATHTHMPSSPLTQSQHILTCRPHLSPNRNTYSHAVLTSHPIAANARPRQLHGSSVLCYAPHLCALRLGPIPTLQARTVRRVRLSLRQPQVRHALHTATLQLFVALRRSATLQLLTLVVPLRLQLLYCVVPLRYNCCIVSYRYATIINTRLLLCEIIHHTCDVSLRQPRSWRRETYMCERVFPYEKK